MNAEGGLGRYPGSPEIARALLRREDRLRLNELHPVDYETLAARFATDKRTAVTRLAKQPPMSTIGLLPTPCPPRLDTCVH